MTSEKTETTVSLNLAKAKHMRNDDGRWLFEVSFDSWGHIQLVDGQGKIYSNVNVIPMFPLTSPDSGVSILDNEFEELLCLDSLSELSEAQAQLVRQELQLREFVPIIQRVISVSGKTEPCEWIVDTNHGRTSFVLNSEEDVHRISNQTVNIIDANGIRFRVEDLLQLDKKSRAFIEWYV